MGLFDFIRSSCYIGEELTDVSCQTKDIDDAIGGSMSQYWIDPSGQLFVVDFSGTADFVEIDPEEKSDCPLLNLGFTWQPNGLHGKVTPVNLTKYVRIYPETHEVRRKRKEARLHFRDGVLQDFNIYEVSW